MKLLIGTSNGVFMADGSGAPQEVEGLAGREVRALKASNGTIFAGAENGVFVSKNGGKSWKLLPARLPFLSAVTWTHDRWLAAGTTGSFQSMDGVTWQRIDSENHNALASTKDGHAWAAGPKGRIARFKR